MVADVKEYIKNCQNCVQQGKICKKMSPELPSMQHPAR